MLNEKLNWRYATKAMDPAKIVPRAKLDAILQAINLAPTSSGLQPFEVFVVTNAEIRAKIRDAAWNQAQITDSTYLLVFAAWDNYTAERIDAVFPVQAHHLGVELVGVVGVFFLQLRHLRLELCHALHRVGRLRVKRPDCGAHSDGEKDDREPPRPFWRDVVDEVMKAHGGTVSVASEPGKGATFTLHFKN